MLAEILCRDKCLKSLPVTQTVNSIDFFSVHLLRYRIKCFHLDFSLTVTHKKQLRVIKLPQKFKSIDTRKAKGRNCMPGYRPFVSHSAPWLFPFPSANSQCCFHCFRSQHDSYFSSILCSSSLLLLFSHPILFPKMTLDHLDFKRINYTPNIIFLYFSFFITSLRLLRL